jgi:hypothetical protein
MFSTLLFYACSAFLQLLEMATPNMLADSIFFSFGLYFHLTIIMVIISLRKKIMVIVQNDLSPLHVAWQV